MTERIDVNQTFNKKCFLYKYIPTFLIIMVLPLLLLACNHQNSRDKSALEWKEGIFQRLQSNLSKPVGARIQEMPPDLFRDIKNYDQSIGMLHASKYVARKPSVEDVALVSSYIHLLPKPYQDAISKKLLAVYFIDNFSSAAMTDWVVDRNRNKYYYMVFNSSLLKSSIDDWLTYRENSYFDNPRGAPRIQVRTSTDFKAIMYGLLHEGAHVIDYELGVTPYFDPLEKKLKGDHQGTYGFVDGVWQQRTQPVAQYDFNHRDELNTYGAITKKGLISRSELPMMFSRLTKSPFVSFYGGLSWNEDFADYMAYQILEQKLGGSIIIDLLDGKGKAIGQYEPIKMHRGGRRNEIVKKICG